MLFRSHQALGGVNDQAHCVRLPQDHAVTGQPVGQEEEIAFDKIKKIIPATIAGVAVYVQTQNWREGISAAYKFYSQNEEGLWQETIATRTINVEELPEHIRKKLENTSKPIDISEELELELES